MGGLLAFAVTGPQLAAFAAMVTALAGASGAVWSRTQGMYGEHRAMRQELSQKDDQLYQLRQEIVHLRALLERHGIEATWKPSTE